MAEEKQSVFQKRSLFYKILLLQSLALLVVVLVIGMLFYSRTEKELQRDKFAEAHQISEQLNNLGLLPGRQGGDFIVTPELNAFVSSFQAHNAIAQVNLVGAEGGYIASSNKELTGKAMNVSLFSRLKDPDNFDRLQLVRILLKNSSTDLDQYVLPLQNNDSVYGYLQVLFHRELDNKARTTFLLMSLLDGFLLITLLGFILHFFFKRIDGQMKHLSQAIDNNSNRLTALPEGLDGEFDALGRALVAWQIKNTPIQSPVKDEVTTITPRQPMNLVILGIKIPNFSQVAANLNTKKYSELLKGLLHTYEQAGNLLGSEFLAFDGKTYWAGLKGEKSFANTLSLIKELKKTLPNLLSAWGKDLDYKFQPIYLIHQGLVQFSRQEVSGISFEVQGGEGFVFAQSLLANLHQGDIWATDRTRMGLQKMCFLSSSEDIEKFIENIPKGLMLVSFDVPIGKRLPILGEEEGLKSSEAKPIKSERPALAPRGMAQLLDETFKEET